MQLPKVSTYYINVAMLSKLVTRMGFEPMNVALRGLRLEPLVDRASNGRFVNGYDEDLRNGLNNIVDMGVSFK